MAEPVFLNNRTRRRQSGQGKRRKRRNKERNRSKDFRFVLDDRFAPRKASAATV